MMRPVLHCELLVIGAGPAGIAAALHAVRYGAEVLLIDQQAEPGGQIWRGQWHALHASPATVDALARPLLCALQAELAAGRLRFRGDCRVVLAPEAGRVTTDGGNGADIVYERLIVACGGRELLLPFPGWTLPGVTGAGALQVMVKDGARVDGQRVVLAGSGPLLLAAANSLRSAGARVCLIAEQRPAVDLFRFAVRLWRWPALLVQALRLRLATLDSPYRGGTWITRAEGRERLQRVHWRNDRGDCGEIACDWLACGFGLVPNLEILALLDALPVQPNSVRSHRPDVFIAGEMTGIGGARRALASGELAAATALADDVGIRRGRRRAARWHGYSDLLLRYFRCRPELGDLAEADTVFCRCESVSASMVRRCRDFRAAKLATRFAMGACQGRICGAAARELYGWPLAHTRAPLYPTPIESFLPSASAESVSASSSTR